MERYKILKTLGDGTYGSVVKAINIQTKEEVAIKKMKKKFEFSKLPSQGSLPGREFAKILDNNHNHNHTRTHNHPS